MTSFHCPKCSKTFSLEKWWVYHLNHGHGLEPVLLNPIVADLSHVSNSDPNVSTSSTSQVDDLGPVVHKMVKRKVGFYVAFDRGQGDEVQPLRVIVPRDESYDKFLSRLRNVFYGEDVERSLRQWEYVLVNRQYEKSDPLPLTSSNTYYAMLSELLRPNSRWRHAVVRRSVSVTEQRAECDAKLMSSSILRIPP